jgi:redox-sensitive bicupin YhaK (pirin superfamily)
MKTTVNSTGWKVRQAAERGHADHGWLQSQHTFSFADYYDPAQTGFRTLRVINEDRVAPEQGFGTHPHRDMEIFSYVLSGALAHRDSLGNERVLKPGQVQLMSAGRGVTHSEFNPAQEPAHFLQIWIQPRTRGLTPGYSEWHPSVAHEGQSKVLVISPDGQEGSAVIQQDARVYRLRLKPGESIEHHLGPGRGAWIQVMRGAVDVNGTTLSAGDGASTEEAGVFTVRNSSAAEPVEALLFDLA